MAKKLDPVIADVLKSYGFGADAAWDCHGTWVVYHRVLEQIAAKAGIAFDPPLPLETNGAGKSVAICVTGRKGDKAEWSIGEAAPSNNKNAYPYAMAEKRAKDRVILKLIGLHGLAYSEDEADDFKASAPSPSAREDKPDPAQVYVEAALHIIKNFKGSKAELRDWWNEEGPARRNNNLSQTHIDILRGKLTERADELEKEAA